jgi:hypothetical protein
MGFLSRLFGSAPPAQRGSAADAGRGLRLTMLTTPPEKTGSKPTQDFPRVYGILMDWPIDEDTATVFATSAGTASLYTTSTFGIIGGEAHESVRIAAMRFVRAADRLFDASTPTTTYEYPARDRVRFYLLTFEGVRVVETDLAFLVNDTSQYAEFFNLGQAVLTELRHVVESRNHSEGAD